MSESVKPKIRLAHRAQYAAVRVVIGALTLVGFHLASAIGAALGMLGYAPLGIRRRVVERQLRAAFPEWSPAQVRHVARASYASLGRTFVETAVLPSYPPHRVLDLCERVEGWDAVEAALAQGRGLLLVGGHIGNWEMAGAYVAARGVALDVVTRGMANPLFDGYLTRTRRRLEMRVVHDADTVRVAPRALRSGRAIALLFDQGAVGLASIWVPFFKRLAKTPRGPAVFALRFEAPMVFGGAIRQPNGKFVMRFEPVETTRTGDRVADVDAMVRAYSDVLERWVRQTPGQYFWQHRRWKHQQPGTPPELGEPT